MNSYKAQSQQNNNCKDNNHDNYVSIQCQFVIPCAIICECVHISHESVTSALLYFRRDVAQQCHHFSRERER